MARTAMSAPALPAHGGAHSLVAVAHPIAQASKAILIEEVAKGGEVGEPVNLPVDVATTLVFVRPVYNSQAHSFLDLTKKALTSHMEPHTGDGNVGVI